MEIITENNSKVGWQYFLDGEKKVLLDFSKCVDHQNLMLFDVRTLCDKVTSLKMQNNAYYLAGYKYLSKTNAEKYLEETFLELESDIIEAKTYCCLNHNGKYQDIKKTYQKLLKEIKLNNYQIVGIPREQYLNGRWNKENEEDYVTKIMIPIKL